MLVTIISISESGNVMEIEMLLSYRRDFSLLLFLIFCQRFFVRERLIKNCCKINLIGSPESGSTCCGAIRHIPTARHAHFLSLPARMTGRACLCSILFFLLIAKLFPFFACAKKGTKKHSRFRCCNFLG